MTLSSAYFSHGLFAVADATTPQASGTVTIGAGATGTQLSAATKAYSVTLTGAATDTATLVTTTGVASLTGTMAKTGGAGEDFEGGAIGTLTEIFGIHIQCTGGSATVALGSGALDLSLVSGSVAMLARTTAQASALEGSMVITAGAASTTVKITIVGNNMATNISIGAAEVNIEIPENTDWEYFLRIKTGGVAVDLTGETFSAFIRPAANSSIVIAELTCEVYDASAGIVRISLDKADNMEMPDGECIWSLNWTSRKSMMAYGTANWKQNTDLT